MTNQRPPDPLTNIFNRTGEYFSEKLGKNVKLERIQPATIQIWTQEWSGINQRKKPDGNFDWAKLRDIYYHKKFPYSDQRRIDIAIWEEKHLCGLAVGGISKEKTYISIDYIEGSPAQHPLKGLVLNIMLAIVEEYARILEIPELRLSDPVDDLIKYYESQYGFQTIEMDVSHPKKGRYCTKKIDS